MYINLHSLLPSQPDLYGRDNCVYHNGYYDFMTGAVSLLWSCLSCAHFISCECTNLTFLNSLNLSLCASILPGISFQHKRNAAKCGCNDCSLSSLDLLQVEEEDEDDESSVSMVQSASPESSELVAETSVPTYIVTSSVPTISPTTGSPNTVQPTAEPLPSFIDVRGRDRQCWWLDIRNQNQKLIRREQNCVRVEVQDTCPSAVDV